MKLLLELDELRDVGATPHVILLLRETFSYRKKIIDDLSSASNVVEKFSQLKQSELVST